MTLCKFGVSLIDSMPIRRRRGAILLSRLQWIGLFVTPAHLIVNKNHLILSYISRIINSFDLKHCIHGASIIPLTRWFDSFFLGTKHAYGEQRELGL